MTLSPLYKLLQKKTNWQWRTEQQEAFTKAKQSLTLDCLLVHYDPDKELVLACDAMPYGIGAVLSHKMEKGDDKPIAFASRTLATAERHYSQLDKECLAIIYGVKKFHQYLCGRHFTLAAYDYKIVYKPGSKHANADTAQQIEQWKGQDPVMSAMASARI